MRMIIEAFKLDGKLVFVPGIIEDDGCTVRLAEDADCNVIRFSSYEAADAILTAYREEMPEGRAPEGCEWSWDTQCQRWGAVPKPSPVSDDAPDWFTEMMGDR